MACRGTALLLLSLTPDTDEACFHVCGSVGVQSSKCWSSVGPTQTFEVPLRDQKAGVSLLPHD
jgi:hypothetical protein